VRVSQKTKLNKIIQSDSPLNYKFIKLKLEDKENMMTLFKEQKFVEIQSSSYLDEDDIVRFEDIYGRIEDL